MSIRAKRGTRAQVNTAAAANGLKPGEMIFVTDEGILAVAITVSTWKTVAEIALASLKGTASELRGMQDDAKFLTGKAFGDAIAWFDKGNAPAGDFIWSMNNGINIRTVLAGNINVLAPDSPKPGATGVLRLQQDATGGRTATWATFWNFGAEGVPTLSTAANVVDRVYFQIEPDGASAFARFVKGS